MGMFPIGELRTSIPLAYHGLGLAWFNSYIFSLMGNSLVALILIYLIRFIGTNNIKFFFDKIPLIGYIFSKWEKSSIEKSKYIEKWSYLGLMLFVGIPLPITGAWTAVLISVFLKLKPFKSYIFISYGLIISGLIVTYFTIFLPNIFVY